ncbi:transporter substrate-binding domain-containing protein, partial [Vibrio parahaemolyticus]|nr:transporter substrate-binding domain-containing protein [Vibrio parahaemolyticus]
LNKAGGDAYEFVGPALTEATWFGEGFGIAVRKQDKDLTKKLDASILSLRDKGVYKEIAGNYFNSDVSG